MSIEERVLRVIAQEGHRDVRPEELDRSFEELGVDSLDKVCILFGLEKEFGLRIPEEDARRFRSVRQVIERLSSLAPEAAPAD